MPWFGLATVVQQWINFKQYNYILSLHLHSADIPQERSRLSLTKRTLSEQQCKCSTSVLSRLWTSGYLSLAMSAAAGRAEEKTERYLKSCTSLASVRFKRFMSVNKMLLISQIFKSCAWRPGCMWPFRFSRAPYSPKHLIYTQVFAESEPNIAKPIIFCLTIFRHSFYHGQKSTYGMCVFEQLQLF